MEHIKNIDFLFEVSWEVCNKVGGIHTVVATKAFTIEKQLKDNYILIGPYLHRDDDKIPEFLEDKNIYKNWRKALREIGLNVKIGRWDILGKPLVFLIDFSPLFSKKNEIFTEFWDTYGLDSLSGQWDYTEPAMFGYAAGMVIKSFHTFHLSIRQNVIAHFHEWMTGSGLLYLKKYMPQIATVFTTHATVLGRSIAGNNLPLYKMIGNVNAEQKAKEFNIMAKFSLEKISALQSDAFTTVSKLTANETKHFLDKEIDVVTPNGFEANIVPDEKEFNEIKKNSYKKLKEVSEALLGYKLSDDVKFVSTSGRYEFKNKGLDVFISVIAKLNSKPNFDREVVALITVPANNYGPRKDLVDILNGNSNAQLDNKFLTHYLHDADFDPILNRIRELGLTNSQEQRVKIIFVPAYLNGNDGIFNIKYYDLLPAFKMTAFPSYYEPWGYTPLESLAFHVPTITTDLTGFGLWIKEQSIDSGECMAVIHRDEDNFEEVVENIASTFITCSYKSHSEDQYESGQAFFVSKTAQWKNLIKDYYTAFNIAIAKKEARTKNLVFEQVTSQAITLPKVSVSKPKWRVTSVIPNLPEKFNGLDELSKNIWWEWNPRATDLFEIIDPELWSKSERNPVKLLKDISYEKFAQLEKNSEFLVKYDKVYNEFKKYMSQPHSETLPSVSYFSMEFGLTNILKIYSGGLGILAGDYLKQASDKNIRMIGVGLLYKFGYFTQKLSIRGEQIETLEPQNFSDLPIELMRDSNGKPLLVQVGLPGRIVYIQIWRVNVGRVPLYLLDSDLEKNNKDDREITHQLYGGDNEHRLKQEIVLGIGGIRALRALGIKTDVYHSNEGHSAFINIERIRQYIQNRMLTFAEALEMVRSSTLFTTHTPVPAGHDKFSEDLLMSYFGHYPERLTISWEDFIKLGKLNPNDPNEEFSMSYLAANLSQEVNGVSWLHGEVTKDMFAKLWDGFFPEELHIGFVTNGVHYQTWAAETWKNLLDKYFDEKSEDLLHDVKVWKKIYEIPDKEIWEARNKLRSDLVTFIKKRITSEFARQRKSPQQIVAVQNKVKDNILTLGFARRFATYKRAHLLLEDHRRLDSILNNPERPVQLIFAGKAHPKDQPGQDLIQRIVEVSKLPQFLGKIIFLENYDIETAKKLVQGVDIWLNTPTRPLEASGTSGMKATMNGVPNFSVLDGWWVEGYKQGAGWALPQEQTFENEVFQDQLDSQMLYDTLENEIIPMFYQRDENGVPQQFVQHIKKSIAQIAPEFTTARMLDDYIERFYDKLSTRKALLRDNDYEFAKKISAWKKRMIISWENIHLVSVKVPEGNELALSVGNEYMLEVVLDLNEISPDNLTVELVITDEVEGKNKILRKEFLKLVDVNDHRATYQVSITPSRAGFYRYAFRIVPHHDLLPHQQDFPLVLWV